MVMGGSKAEISYANASAGFAEAVDCRVIRSPMLDRGGVHCSHLIGTLELLSTQGGGGSSFDRNRFPQRHRLLQPASDWLGTPANDRCIIPSHDCTWKFSYGQKSGAKGGGAGAAGDRKPHRFRSLRCHPQSVRLRQAPARSPVRDLISTGSKACASHSRCAAGTGDLKSACTSAVAAEGGRYSKQSAARSAHAEAQPGKQRWLSLLAFRRPLGRTYCCSAGAA